MKLTHLYLYTIIFAFLTTGVSNAQETPWHLFILSGQSNMAGMNPKLGLEPELKNQFGEQPTHYIKVAVGGQPIRHWLTNWDELARSQGIDPAKTRLNDKIKDDTYYQTILRDYQTIVAKLSPPKTITFCWMQGERDAREKLDSVYRESLAQLISNLRRDLKCPDMIFVIGRLSDHGTTEDKPWQTIRQIQVSIAESDPRGAWVDCDDLNDKPKDGQMTNDLHYTKHGYEVLGRRFVRQAKAIMEGKKPDSTGRPD